MLIAWIGPLRGSNQIFCPDKNTLGTRGFSRERREFSVLAEGRHIFGRRPKPRAAKPGHYKDLTETGNRARKVSGTQSTIKKLTWANGKVQILEVWFGLDQQEGLKFRGEDQKSEERFAFF